MSSTNLTKSAVGESLALSEGSRFLESGPGGFEKLARFIRWHRGRFALGLVRVNEPQQRDEIIVFLRPKLAREGIDLIRVDLGHREVRSLLQELEMNSDLQKAISIATSSTALALVGLERSIVTPAYPKRQTPYFLVTLNLERDTLAQRFRIPITFWLTDLAMDRVAADAPDFFDYRSNMFTFGMAFNELLAPVNAKRGTEAVRESREGLSRGLLVERRELLQARLDDLKRKRETTPAQRGRMAEIYLEMGELDLSEPDTGDRGRAIHYLMQALPLFQELEDKAGEACVLGKIGDAYYWIDKLESAQAKYKQALPIYREIGDRLGEANALRSLGHLAECQANYKIALDFYSQTLTISQTIGDRLGMASTLWGQGQTHKLQRDYELARAAFAKAERIYREIGNAQKAAECRREIETLPRVVPQVARQAIQSANLEQGSFLRTALDNPNADLSWMTTGRFDQVIIEPTGKRTVRVEDRNLVVDGRLNLERVRAQWKIVQTGMDQLSQQGFSNLTADPESGAVAGYNAKTGETVALVPRATGDPMRRSFTQLPSEPRDLAVLVTVLGAQSHGSPTVGFFETPKNELLLLNSNGEARPFLSGAETTLRELEQAALIPGNRERTRQLADQLKDGLRRDMQEMFVSQWKVINAKSAEELVYEAYVPAKGLFPTAVPADVAKQIKGPVRPGDIVRLQPIETSYGWLLPNPAPGDSTFFLDAPTSLSYLISYDLSANKIRLIDSHSTPLSAQDYVSREQLVPSKNVVVLFSPHSESTPEQIKAQRDLFQPTRERLERLGVRVIDLGGDSSAREKILTELADARNAKMVIVIGQSGADGQFYVQGEKKILVHPSDLKAVSGAEHFITSSGFRNGLTEAAVRAGTKSATGSVEPITLREGIKQLDVMADYLEQHPEGVRPSEMENELRLRILIENSGPGYEPLPLDIS